MAECLTLASGRMMIRAFDRVVSPFCFDGAEHELAESIVRIHDDLVSIKGFAPEVPDFVKEEMTGKVLSVVSSSFSTVFECAPSDRYEDVFDQIAEFATRLSKDHIFPDGNKRTTVKASISILSMCRIEIDLEDAEDPEHNELYRWIQDVVTEGRTIEQLAEALRSRASLRIEP